MESLHPAPIEAEEIDLSLERVDYPKDAIEVRENAYVIATYDPSNPRPLFTDYLYTCHAVSFYDRENKRGLLAHISVVEDADASIADLVTAFGDIGAADATLISGSDVSAEPKVVPIDLGVYWPAFHELAKAIQRHGPERLITDSHPGRLPKAIMLDLETGIPRELGRGEYIYKRHLYDDSLSKKLVQSLAD